MLPKKMIIAHLTDNKCLPGNKEQTFIIFVINQTSKL